MKKNNLLYLSLIFFLFSQIALGAESKENSILKLSSNYFEFIQKDNFNAAAKLFHYPKSYSNDELKKDITAVTKFIELFKNEFGKISNAEISKAKVVIMSLTFGGGTLPYWKKNPNFTSIIYKVNFSNLGIGYITFNITNIENKAEIKDLKYGLSTTRSGGKEALVEIMKKMKNMMKTG